MKTFAIFTAGACGFLGSCDEASERMMVEETRELTTKDREPKLFATSDERFRESGSGPVEGDAPENWLVMPAAQFRVLNYRFGESGISEVYVSLLTGGVLENVNRWRKQFGRDPLGGEAFLGMEKVRIAGGQGVWVEAEGDYGAGMGGGGSKPGYGLAGVVGEVDGKIITIKMIGPKDEVNAEKLALRAFAASLKMVE